MFGHIRHSFRLWLGAPVVTIAIVFTLAIAIGANTAVFSVFRVVLLAPLPYPEADRLAILWSDEPSSGIHQEGVSYPNYADWRAMNRTFADLAFFWRTDYSQVNITGAETPERVQSALVSGNFFRVVGADPIRGRAFTEDELKTRANLAILGAGLAARRFGSGDPIGRTIQLDGQPATIVGIMPASFHFPTADTEVWQPYTRFIPYQPATRDSDYLCVLGRLKHGVAIATARADMAEVGKRLERAHPNMPAGFGGFGVNVVPLFEHVYGKNTSLALWLIAAVASCVLLIAVINVANLLLARLQARDREFAVRMALGAGIDRLTLQIVTETGLLAAVGAALGLGLAYAGLRVLAVAFGAYLPRLDQATIDWSILGFSIAIACGACLLAALAPVGHLRHEMLAEGIRKRNATPVKRGFAIAQVAFATALLACAGLLLRSYALVERSQLGYNPDRLLVFELIARQSHPVSPADSDAYGARVTQQVRERIRNLPGVVGVANAGDLFLRRNPDWQIYVEGSDRKPEETPQANDIVTSEFFRVMGTPLLAGRLFTPEEERDPNRGVVLINDAMARRYWPGADPLGKRFAVAPPPKQKWYSVIGVVGNMQLANRESDPIPEMFWATANDADLKFIVRAASDPIRQLAAIRREVRAVDTDAVVYRPSTVEAQLDGWMAPRKMNTSIVGIFSAMATLLAAIGIFSLLHYTTALRTREFGVRFALGATRSNVLRMVVRDGVSLAGIGGAIGATGAIAAARTFSALLFGVQAWDPVTLATAVIGAMLLAAAASAAPAIRAALLNPSDALRSE